MNGISKDVVAPGGITWLVVSIPKSKQLESAEVSRIVNPKHTN